MNMNSSTNPNTAPTGYAGYYAQKAAVSSTPSASIVNPTVTAPSSPYKVIDIGTQFCKQYYRMLSVEPEAGYKFYSKLSHLTHGDEGNLEVPMCFGLEEIQQRILSMGFAGCRVFISTIDCQASLQGGVVVVVIGKMQMTGGVLRKFVQSIFLAEQPTGFFVLNDVFRFIEEEEAQSPIQLPHHQQSTATATAAVTPLPQPIQPPTTAAQTIPQQQQQEQQEQPAKTEATWGDSAWNIDAPVPSVSSPATATTATSAAIPASSSSPAKQQPIKKPTVPVKEQAPEEPVKVSESPSSWAAITVDHQSKWGNGVVSGAKGTSVAAPPKTHDHGKVAETRHFKTRKSTTDNSTTTSNSSPAATTSSSNPSNANQRPRRQFNDTSNYEASIFVGNVKSRVDESMIRQAFSSSGAIKSIEIARECVFVEFETVESARKAIAGATVTLNGQDYKVDKRRAPRPHSSSASTLSSSTPSTNSRPPRFQTRNTRPGSQQQSDSAADGDKK